MASSSLHAQEAPARIEAADVVMAEAPAASRVVVRRLDAHRLLVEATFPAHTNGASVMPDGAQRMTLPGISLPGFTRELAVEARSLSVESVESIEEPGDDITLSTVGDVALTNDAADDHRRASALERFSPADVYPGTWADVSYSGRIGGVPVSIVRLYPYRYDPQRRVVLTARRLRLVVTIDPISSLADIDGIARAFTSAAASGKAGARALQQAEPTRTIVAPNGSEYKIYVARDGIVRLSARKLLDAGIPLDAIDARTIRLFLDGIEQPLLVADRGNNRLDDIPLVEEYIEFFGQRKRPGSIEPGSDLYFDPFTRNSVYFLTWGSALGKRIVEESGAIRSVGVDPSGDLTDRSRSFTSTIHLEQDRIQVSLGNSELNTLSDRFDRRMWGRVPPNEIASFPVLIPAPNVLSSEPLRMRAAVRSTLANDDAADSADASVRGVTIYVNNYRLLNSQLRAVALSLLSTDSNAIAVMTADQLARDDESTITVANEYSPRQTNAGEVNVNWFELTYPRLYRAVNDSITFSTPTGLGARYYTFRIRGFTTPDIRVYRRGISRITNVTIAANTSPSMPDTSYDAIFQAYVAGEGEEFLAIGGSGVIEPVIRADVPVDLRDARNAADYLVIIEDRASRPDRLDDPSHALRRFAALKERDGYTVRIVRAADIYDEFNGGSVSPAAIKQFLSYAWHNWSKSPRYALIVGNGDAMHVEELRNEPEEVREIIAESAYVPSIMLQTVLFGATPCDYLYGCISGKALIRTNTYEGARQTMFDDLVAEVVVGRVAVDTYEQIEAFVDKLVEQETQVDNGEWRNRQMFIAGWEPVQSRQVDAAVESTFRFRSEPHRFMMADGYRPTKYWIGTRSVVDLLDSGVGLVTYLGHGGGGQWEAGAELSITTAETVRNRRHMPPILSLTCFTGAYNADQCLLGRLLVSPNGGAVVALGTAGFGWLNNNGLFAEAIFSILRNPRYRHLTFGEAITLAKALYVGTYQTRFPDHVPTVAAMYSILGDPSLRIPATQDTVTLETTTPIATAGGRLAASTTLPFAPARVTAHLFDTTEVHLAGVAVDARMNGNRIELSATVPPGYDGLYAGLRVYASDDAGARVTGSIRMPGATSMAATVHPSQPLRAGSDAHFEIVHLGTTPIDSVWITIRYANPAVTVLNAVAYAVNAITAGRFAVAPISAALIEPGAIIEVRLPPITNVAGQRTTTFYVPGGADPAAFVESSSDSTREQYGPRASFTVGSAINESLAMVSTPTGPRLAATFHNWGDIDAPATPYGVEYDSAGTRVRLGGGTVDLPARDSSTILIDVGSRAPRERTTYVSVAPPEGNRWIDSYALNNAAYRNIDLASAMVSRGVGTTADGASSSPVSIQGVGQLSVDAAEAQGTGLILARLDTIAPVTEQRWKLLTIGSGAITGTSLRLRADGITGATPVALTLVVNDAAALPADASIVGYDPTTRLWLAYPTARADATKTVTATVPASGLYAIARVSDQIGPRIRFSVEGQLFLDSSAVPADARFSAVITDESGIDPEGISATLDGVSLELGSDVVWLDSTITPTSASVRIQKPVAAGRHELCVTARDRVGNNRSECTTFEVDGELAITLYGNFPNPFASETFIAYEIRGASVVDAVELKIFSTAGKLVRTFRFPTTTSSETRGLFTGGTGEPTSVGYHEVWWDGLDDRGRDVANGVYFYRVRVEVDDSSIEEIGTLARIR